MAARAQDTASPDIDVALDDNVMGAQFAAAVSEYLTSVGEEARGIGVIKSNPEQSKHLETATMRVGSYHPHVGAQTAVTLLADGMLRRRPPSQPRFAHASMFSAHLISFKASNGLDRERQRSLMLKSHTRQ